MNISKIINEEVTLLLEKIYNISDQVDLLYDKFFKDDIIKVNKGEYDNVFKTNQTTSEIFTSDLLIDAHNKNPIKIIINGNRYVNAYDFKNKILYLSINNSAFYVVKDYRNIESAVKDTGYTQLYNEFTEKKIKSSIRHELIHWLDDTYTDLFNKRKIFKTTDDWVNYKKNNYEYFDKFEVNSVIGNIYEIKRNINNELWNKISFEEMLGLLPSLNNIRREMKKRDVNKYNKWKRDILTRMSREGFIGNNMKFK